MIFLGKIYTPGNIFLDFLNVQAILPPGDGVVGQAGDLGLSLLDDGHGEDSQVSVDDASTHRLTLALSGPKIK